MRKLGACLIALAAAVVVGGPAIAGSQAPPRYVDSEPGRGEQLHEAPEEVRITFDQPLDQSSFIEVQDHCDRRVDGGDSSVTANEMRVGLALRPSGTYHVTYFARGIGGVTGQVTGKFEFVVHAGPSCGAGGGHGRHGATQEGGHAHGGDPGHQEGHEQEGHEGAEHGGISHSEHLGSGTGDTGHGEHAASSTGAHGEHGAGGRHAGADHRAGDHAEVPHFANTLQSGPGGALGPTGAAVATSVALSIVFGVIGGWVLRATGRLA